MNAPEPFTIGHVKARVGIIVPSSNRLAEPQFSAFMPNGIGVHTARIRMTGRHRKSLEMLTPHVAEATQALDDAKCDVVVFHCTSNAMEHGAAGERLILDTVSKNTSALAVSTAQAILSAMRALQMRKIMLVSPYGQATNDHEKQYLKEFDIDVVADVALNRPVSDGYIAVTPEEWRQTVTDNARSDVDGYFLSCANATHIQAVDCLEKELGKPVVSSNQATIWWCAMKLKSRMGDLRWTLPMGRLTNKIPD